MKTVYMEHNVCVCVWEELIKEKERSLFILCKEKEIDRSD